MKKGLLVFTALLTGAVMVFAGGAKQGSQSAAAGGKQPLSIAIQSNAIITDYENNYLTQYMEKLHNVDIEFYMLPDATMDLRTKVSLMVTSNDLQDLLFTNGALTNEQILDYGSKGAFVPLNNYLSDPVKAPNYAKIPEEDKRIIIDAVTSADGNIYALPRFEIETRNLTPYWLFYNQAWADKLGLKAPTTTAELKNMLIAFRDGDPNGNGRKDEMGLYCWYGGGFGEDTISYLINCFVFYNKNNLALDASGQKVIAPFTEPAFRKALVYLNDLYKEGVLSASSFSDDQTTYRSILNMAPAVVGFTSAGFSNHWPDANNNANYQELTMIKPLTGPDGVSYVPYTGYIPAKTTFVTTKARDKDLAFKFAESFFDREISTIARYGEPEVDWTRDPEQLKTLTSLYVEMGLFPGLTIVDKTNMWSFPNNKMWHGSNPRWAWTGEAETRGFAYSPYNPALKGADNGGLNYQFYMNAHPRYVLPPLRYSIDDAIENAEAITNINTYVQQIIAEFTIGARDINNDTAWATYIRELDSLGLQQWIKIAQETYDRQK